MNKNAEHKLDGIVAFKVIIAMLENLLGRIDQALPLILQICVSELNENSHPKANKSYKSMILQTIAMCFHYNSELTFQLLEQNNWTIPVFQQWLQTMPIFKHDFEIRRVIFGLTAIIKTNPQIIPAIVAQRLPELVRQLALLSLKMKDERVKILKDNENYLKEH